jgi:glycosyltransferase involved in cell wall biosynthesis
LFASAVYVIVPAFNEQPRIAAMLRSVPSWVTQIVVIDDASTDDTQARVAECAATDARIVYRGLARNGGVGAAIANGYRYLLATVNDPRAVFVVMAGDGQMKPSDLERVVAPVVAQHADYVKGERFSHHDVRRIMPGPRYWAGRALSWCTSQAVGFAVSDSQCGYTAISREACSKLDFDTFWYGYGYPNDVLGQLAARNLRVFETPVEPSYEAGLQSKLRAYHVPAIGFVIARSFVRRVSKRP